MFHNKRAAVAGQSLRPEKARVPNLPRVTISEGTLESSRCRAFTSQAGSLAVSRIAEPLANAVLAALIGRLPEQYKKRNETAER